MFANLHLAQFIKQSSKRFRGFYNRNRERIDIYPFWDDLPCSFELMFGDFLYYGLFDRIEEFPDNVKLKVFRFDVGSDDYQLAIDKDNIQRYNFTADNPNNIYHADFGGFVCETLDGYIFLFLVACYKHHNGKSETAISPFELIKT